MCSTWTWGAQKKLVRGRKVGNLATSSWGVAKDVPFLGNSLESLI